MFHALVFERVEQCLYTSIVCSTRLFVSTCQKHIRSRSIFTRSGFRLSHRRQFPRCYSRSWCPCSSSHVHAHRRSDAHNMDGCLLVGTSSYHFEVCYWFSLSQRQTLPWVSSRAKSYLQVSIVNDLFPFVLIPISSVYEFFVTVDTPFS